MARETPWLEGLSIVHPPPTAMPESLARTAERTLILAEKIQDYTVETGEPFDRLTVIARGGYLPGLIVASALGFTGPDILHMGFGSYNAGVWHPSGELKTGDMPPQESIEGLSHLIVDDCCDSGKSLVLAKGYYEARKARLVKAAAVVMKDDPEGNLIEPDFWGIRIPKAVWIDYVDYDQLQQKGVAFRAWALERQAGVLSTQAAAV